MFLRLWQWTAKHVASRRWARSSTWCLWTPGTLRCTPPTPSGSGWVPSGSSSRSISCTPLWACLCLPVRAARFLLHGELWYRMISLILITTVLYLLYTTVGVSMFAGEGLHCFLLHGELWYSLISLIFITTVLCLLYTTVGVSMFYPLFARKHYIAIYYILKVHTIHAGC